MPFHKVMTGYALGSSRTGSATVNPSADWNSARLERKYRNHKVTGFRFREELEEIREQKTAAVSAVCDRDSASTLTFSGGRGEEDLLFR